MGKFKSGMVKYGNNWKAVFNFDDSAREQILAANHLNHAEQLVTAPIRITVNTITAGILGTGLVVGGVSCLAFGLLFSKSIAKDGIFLTLLGVTELGAGVAGSVEILLKIPYNGVKAYQHRKRKSENNEHVVQPEINTSSGLIIRQLEQESPANATLSATEQNNPQDKRGQQNPINVESIPTILQLIVQSFECPITHELMQEPVLCTLDGRTYEREEITQWLAAHRSSPITREKMTPDQKIADVLKPNRALADAIAGFRIEHPELFETKSRSSSLSR
ncbi:Ribosomal protein L16/L10E [Legionella sainthelensi]|uniref:U-box domain-containing protein n=1 Tax=Legionella sainthelensi TaxID=28087 RepID=UPI000E202AB6|nr:U-box domain-containing protein [Legionella sainthelensi]VEB32405.1 Ribosomal protein L16/L10E [Legionella sainthelensi]